MIVAVVPAAGQSRRMGVNKQLLPFAGTTVIGHIVDELLRSRAEEVRVVAGHEADRLRQELGASLPSPSGRGAGGEGLESETIAESPAPPQTALTLTLSQRERGRKVRIIVNPDYARSDMLASVRCGLAGLPAGCRAVLVALGDQPAIRAGLIDAMIDRFSAAGRGIVVPVHEGKRGHPLLFAASYCGEVLTDYDQQGLRGLLAAHPGEVLELPVESPLVLSDMDYPEDYQRALENGPAR